MTMQQQLHDRHAPALADGAPLVPVVFTRSVEEAEEYCTLLSAMDIPVRLGDDDSPVGSGLGASGTPVLVPETCHSLASEIIASHEAANAVDNDEEDDSFYDDDDDDDDDLDDDDDDDFLDDDDTDDDLDEDLDDDDWED
jgi:hypothetical protein